MNANRIVVTLICSTLGLITAIAYVKRPAENKPAETPTTPASEDNAPASAVAPAAESKATAAIKREPSSSPPFSWRQIESAEYKQYIANLRGVGCPEQTIRDIILADVNKLYAEREAPLKAKPAVAGKNAPTEVAVPADELEKRRQLREIQMEKRNVIKELLGIDLPLDLLPSSGSRNYSAYELALKLLPAEKRDQIQLLQEGYWRQSDALKAKYNNKRTPEYLEEYRAISDAHRQELAKVLTPAELENYEIRTSTSANRLGQQLVNFSPSEEEFRQIFRATRDYDDKVATLTGPGVDPAADKKFVQQERAAAASERDEQLRAALGEQRYSEYQRAQDAKYRNLVRVAERYNLPQETVMQAYELEKTFASQPAVSAEGNAVVFDGGNALKQGPNREALQQLNEQLIAVLGDKAAKAYRRVRGGLIMPDPEP
jgi:hypothetical protein